MSELEPTHCLHCERRPACGGLGLCARCQAVRGIRQLYVRRRGWTPQWEEHLRRLAGRARRRLPLFDDPPDPGAAPDVPPHCA
jgi:hypothetical protein